MPECASPPNDGHALKRAHGLVLVLNTAKGRGAFASKPIPKNTVIDVSPVLIFSEDEVARHIERTCLNHYTYYWPSPSSRSLTQALALGLGSLFNHSTLHQNIGWRRDLSIDCIVYIALRDIDEGEELCISYGSGRLWFPDTDELAGGGTDAAMRDAAGQDEDDCRAGTLGELELSGLNGIGIDAEEEKENAVDDGKARDDMRREPKP